MSPCSTCFIIIKGKNKTILETSKGLESAEGDTNILLSDMLQLHEYLPSAIVQIKIYSYKYKKKYNLYTHTMELAYIIS